MYPLWRFKNNDTDTITVTVARVVQLSELNLRVEAKISKYRARFEPDFWKSCRLFRICSAFCSFISQSSSGQLTERFKTYWSNTYYLRGRRRLIKGFTATLPCNRNDVKLNLKDRLLNLINRVSKATTLIITDNLTPTDQDRDLWNLRSDFKSLLVQEDSSWW